jgi:cell division protein FtsW (lipid II flippase)
VFGVSRGGARNWVSLFGYIVQPSEFIKILFVFFLACYFSGDRKGSFHGIPARYITNLTAYLFMGFLVLQREWGIMVLFFITYMLLEYIYESDWLLIGGNMLMAAIVGLLGYHSLYHIQVRVANWIDPWQDVANKGYQIAQSLFAIAAGGFFGSGVGLGKPDLIPEVYSDFIFSAICEEMGMFGGVAVILLYFIFIYRGVKIALLLPESFDKCVVVGMTVLFGIQTFIILGGVIKFIPLTGITLPFVSYGGSSLVSCFIQLGIMQAISMEVEKS